MKKILIIENEKAVRESTQMLLQAQGYEVLTAKNGRLGMELAQSQNPDLIICDVMMPGMNGYQVLTELQQQATTATIPFIFLTALAESTDLRIGMNLGADDYLIKPFRLPELLNSIEIRLSKKAEIFRHYEAEIREAEEKLFRLVNFTNLQELEELARMLEADSILIYLEPQKGEELELIATYPDKPTAESFSSSVLVEEVFKKQEANYYRLKENRYMAYLPLTLADTILGVLVVGINIAESKKLNSNFFERELQLALLTAARQIALSVAQTRLAASSHTPDAEQTNKLDITALGTLSHELRTPLTSIKNAVTGLKDAKVALSPTEQAEYLDLIDEEVNRLEKLVGHLLDINRLESGTLRLEKGLFYLPELINATLDRLAQFPPFSQHPFESVFEGDFPLISVDYLQIEQLLTNLVENAARYSPVGRPITVRATQAPRLTNRSEESRLGIV